MSTRQNSDIRTTVNVRKDLHDKIEEYSNKYNLSKNKIMKIFIEKMITELLSDDKFKSHAIQYQLPYPEWEHPHITLSNCEYDRFLDVKKVYRFSLSLILAMALENFSESILFEKEMHSYPAYLYQKSIYIDITTRKYTFSWIQKEEGRKKTPE